MSLGLCRLTEPRRSVPLRCWVLNRSATTSKTYADLKWVLHLAQGQGVARRALGQGNRLMHRNIYCIKVANRKLKATY